MDLPKEYNISQIEEKWQNYWEKEKIYTFDEKSKKQIFSVDTPPPTVSGKMHIGHAFSYSQQDFIVRYKRMNNYNIFYPFGTDDNGLPTERLIEKLKKVKSTKMNRQEFIDLCNKTLNEIKPDFINDWKKIGMSCDFSNSYSTIDKHSIKTSQKSFIELYKKSLVYQKESPTMFCVNCQTAIAQAELEDKELESNFVDVDFHLEDSRKITISTTRPELISACVAIFVHPNDKKYKSFINKKVKVPLSNHFVTILADNSVDTEKGTGAMMICSYGDKSDVEAIKKLNLQPRVILSKDGKLNELAGKYNNLSIKDARKEILNDLEKSKLIAKKQNIKHIVNVHDKCGTEIEFLSSKQWFIKILDNKKNFIEAGKKINWYPSFMLNRYLNWVGGLQWDWSISRQRHFGVPFPLWICEKCNEIILADENKLPIDPLNEKVKCKKCNTYATPEKDVMDTWATSSLTPQIVLNWAEKGNNFSKFYPMSLRANAHEIIRTWDFYTIVKGLYHHNMIPWKGVFIAGFVTLEGEKMSKSKGNVIEPQMILDKYGADVLRFWSSSSKLGEDTNYQEKDFITGKRTVTKLFNASKLILMNLKDYKDKKPEKLELIDFWLLSKLNNVIKICKESFDKYEYSKAKAEIENFFWNTFCDYYLEIVKDRLYNENLRGKDAKLSAQYTLNHSLLTILKLFSPIMPHVTEEIYHYYFSKKEKLKSIHLSSWPEYNKFLNNRKAEEVGDKMINIIKEVRTFKTKNNKSMKAEIELTLEKDLHQKLKHVLGDLKSVTNAKNINFGDKFEIKI